MKESIDNQQERVASERQSERIIVLLPVIFIFGLLFLSNYVGYRQGFMDMCEAHNGTPLENYRCVNVVVADCYKLNDNGCQFEQPPIGHWTVNISGLQI